VSRGFPEHWTKPSVNGALARRRERLVVVSDLHMSTADGPVPDPFADDEAFAGLLAALTSDGVPTRLILLGDTVDLVLAAAPSRTRWGTDRLVAARRGLDAIAGAHPRVFAALGAFSRAGYEIDVVPGNHDIGLLHRSLQQRLRELIAGGTGGRHADSPIRFWPWIVHLPGVLYAEHGQQHHDINHFREVLMRAEPNPCSRGSDPPGVRLDEALAELAGLLGVAAGSPQAVVAALVAHVRGRRPGASAAVVRAAALGGGLARAGLGLSVGPRRSGHAEHERRLRDHARELGLSAEVLLELDRRATPTLLTIARRMVGSAATGTGSQGRSMPDAFAVAAARSVAEALAGTGGAPPFYVFGHTHVARDRPLWARGGAPRYLNAGTWSSMVRPGRDHDEDRLRFVEVEHGANRPPIARLRRWDGERMAARLTAT
jgi:UDP-2,3-diacylglucosamine pyrophosphatase LpxH